MTRPLTPKQQRFVDAYAGNGVEACRMAGYKGSDETLAAVAYENLRKPQIAEAIQKRDLGRKDKLIATREERQAFWTQAMRDENRDIFVRLRASELLGKSEADFTEKLDAKVAATVTVSINGVATKPKENP